MTNKFAILRVQKLKSGQAVMRSLKHTFREQDTPNADPSRTRLNLHVGSTNSAEAIDRFNRLLPEKIRKNAVLAVEYLITASPETMKIKTPDERGAFFTDALKWLKQKHGKENVFQATIHQDESTPHMVAYVVPIDSRGKLNCRSFLGERDALSKMQTDFVEKVGVKHGLERGVERSKARHTTIREYYGRANANKSLLPPKIALPEPEVMEDPKAYGKRVTTAYTEAISPEFRRLDAKIKELEAERKSMEQTKLLASRITGAMKGVPRELVARTWQFFGEAVQRARATMKPVPDPAPMRTATTQKPDVQDKPPER
jgi:hypothetical protein